MDAVARRHDVQRRDRPSGDDLVLGRGAVAGGDQQVLPHGHVCLRAVGRRSRRHQRMVSAAQTRGAVRAQEHRRRIGVRAVLLADGRDDGRRLGRAGGPDAADEAGGHGSPLRRAPRGGTGRGRSAPTGRQDRPHERRQRVRIPDRNSENAVSDGFPRRERLRSGHQRSGIR